MLNPNFEGCNEFILAYRSDQILISLPHFRLKVPKSASDEWTQSHWKSRKEDWIPMRAVNEFFKDIERENKQVYEGMLDKKK